MSLDQRMPNEDFDDVRFALNMGEPSAEVLAWAKENINETEEDRAMKIYELREMIFGKCFNWNSWLAFHVIIFRGACLNL